MDIPNRANVMRLDPPESSETLIRCQALIGDQVDTFEQPGAGAEVVLPSLPCRGLDKAHTRSGSCTIDPTVGPEPPSIQQLWRLCSGICFPCVQGGTSVDA